MKESADIIIFLVGTLIYIWNERRKKKNALLTPEQLLSTYRKSAKVYALLADIRDQFKPKRAYIFQFQNGGKWHSGESVQRMSMTHESKYFELKSIKQKNQNVLIASHEHPFFENLLLYKQSTTDNVLDLPVTTYQTKLLIRKVKSIYYFLLEDSKTRRPIGMLVLSYPIANGLTNTEIVEIKDQATLLSEILMNNEIR